MLISDFKLPYLEIALSKMKDLDECNHVYIIDFLDYLKANERYAGNFPDKFYFELPNGKIDESYLDVEECLLKEELYEKRGMYLVTTSIGREFFEKLHTLCMQAEITFSKYFSIHC